MRRAFLRRLCEVSRAGPYAERAHPYPDHFMPLLVAFGAAGDDARGTVLDPSWYWGDLAMDAYELTLIDLACRQTLFCQVILPKRRHLELMRPIKRSN